MKPDAMLLLNLCQIEERMAPMPGSRVRTRLSVEQRRRQLIQLGMEMFSSRAYEDILIEEIAHQATHHWRQIVSFVIQSARQLDPGR